MKYKVVMVRIVTGIVAENLEEAVKDIKGLKEMNKIFRVPFLLNG